MTSLLYGFDNSILQFIQSNMRFPAMDKLMIFVTWLGNMGIIWIAIALILMLTKKYRIVGVIILFSLSLGAIIGEGILKHLFERTRPFTEAETIKILINKPSTYSFPSGHATAAFSAVSVLIKYFKKYSLLFWIMAILIAFSRLYLYVHYPTDVLAGAILGLVCGNIILYIFKIHSLGL